MHPVSLTSHRPFCWVRKVIDIYHWQERGNKKENKATMRRPKVQKLNPVCPCTSNIDIILRLPFICSFSTCDICLSTWHRKEHSRWWEISRQLKSECKSWLARKIKVIWIRFYFFLPPVWVKRSQVDATGQDKKQSWHGLLSPYTRRHIFSPLHSSNISSTYFCPAIFSAE